MNPNKFKPIRISLVGVLLSLVTVIGSGAKTIQNMNNFHVNPTALGLTDKTTSKIDSFSSPSAFVKKATAEIAFTPTTGLSSITSIGLASEAIFNFLKTGFTSIGDTTFPTLQALCENGKNKIPFQNGQIVSDHS